VAAAVVVVVFSISGGDTKLHVIKTGSNARKTTYKEFHYKTGDQTLTSMPIISEVSAVSTMTPLYTH
jgi:hypothetical protein